MTHPDRPTPPLHDKSDPPHDVDEFCDDCAVRYVDMPGFMEQRATWPANPTPPDTEARKALALDSAAGYGKVGDAVKPEPFLADVAAEIAKARAKHAPMNSLHEAYAVILEELDEFWEEVRAWRGNGRDADTVKARKELVQVAAMAMRAATDLLNTEAAGDSGKEVGE